ncbi:DUF4402 domain-containing protein [Novosphingobium nitrogenifigens]|nr:DUF4402 domain-containing protein [Novosphingobium nitrogenifigens]
MKLRAMDMIAPKRPMRRAFVRVRRSFAHGRSRVLIPALLGTLAIATPASATPGSLSLLSNQPLRFGTIVTVDGGSRTVGADGSTINSNVFPLGDRTSGPAQFTLVYNRPGNDKRAYQLTFAINLPSVPNVRAAGVQGTLSGFTTDLPGIPVLQPGRTALYTLSNCMSDSCSVTFHIGGTLNVERTSGGGELTFPLVLMTSVVAVLG